MSKRVLVVLLTYDEPECGGAADALVEHLQRDAAAELDCALEVKPIAISANGSHRDALYGSLQDLFQVKPEDIYVISFFKGNQPEEYKKMRDLCNGVKPHALQYQLLTHLANYGDVGLVIRNLVRAVMNEMGKGAPSSPQ